MDIYKSYGIDIQIYNQRPVMDGETGGASHQRLLRGRDPVLEKGEDDIKFSAGKVTCQEEEGDQRTSTLHDSLCCDSFIFIKLLGQRLTGATL